MTWIKMPDEVEFWASGIHSLKKKEPVIYKTFFGREKTRYEYKWHYDPIFHHMVLHSVGSRLINSQKVESINYKLIDITDKSEIRKFNINALNVDLDYYSGDDCSEVMRYTKFYHDELCTKPIFEFHQIQICYNGKALYYYFLEYWKMWEWVYSETGEKISGGY